MPLHRASNRIDRLTHQARALGCPDLLRLDGEATAAHLDYLDLMPSRSNAPVLPDAVAEFQGRPLLYLVDRIDEADEPHLETRQVQDLQTLIANRSEHACLGVVKPGSLDVYPINLDRKTLAQADFRTVQIAHPDAPTFFQSLATGSFELPGRPKQADYVFETIHALLTKASEELAGTKDKPGPMRGLDVLSTTGRALFFRFLIDRRIVLPMELSQISPKAEELQDVFSSAEKAATTSCWLDETFNGDLLPLVTGLGPGAGADERFRIYHRFYKEMGQATGQRLFAHLQAILRGWQHAGGSRFQTTFDIDWNDFNFAHIPIGVLSQVYETFSRQWDEQQSKESSIYYTPRNIARLLVEEAFAGLEHSAEAVVLDPACGAGVFLVLAFRQLIRKCWEKGGHRPDTRTIQRILYKQLRGFEVSESALRLSALALYISAIEVNGTPRPPPTLKFPRPLRDEVLFNFGHHETDQKRGFVLGSLGSHVPLSFNHSFDIVVTNPPWTRLRASSENAKDKAKEKERAVAMNGEFTTITRRVLASRGLEKLARHYSNPDNNPDLPFLWRATEWARRDGIIAMALPGRVILKQSGKGKAARHAIMQGLAITGILNGSDLEKTAVWPNMKLPFMLLFARNSLPKSDHHFHFVTPIRENRLSTRGQFRLDYKAAQALVAREVIEKPFLLKALAVGTILDVEVTERLASKGWKALNSVWKDLSLHCGDGYHLFPKEYQKTARDLFDFLDFERPEAGFSIEAGKLVRWRTKYQRNTAHAPRTKELFSAPLIIIPQTPGDSRERPKSFLSRNTGMTFHQGNYGFSGAGNPAGELLVSLLYLITHSQLYQHFCLIRSSRIGASYRTFIKEDLEAFPFPRPEQLTVEQQRRVLVLSDLLENREEKPWNEIDEFIFNLYGLDDHDSVVVRDTVTVCGPYQCVRKPAEQPPSSKELEIFRAYFEEMLQPLFEIVGQNVSVTTQPVIVGDWNPPWRFLFITLTGDSVPDTRKFLTRLMRDANKTGASRIVLRVPSGGLLVGILNQRRFWTRSRARLCSLYIEEHHLDAFRVPTQ